MKDLFNKLVNKKNVAKSTADNYIKNLYRLNDKKLYSSLNFLKNYDDIKNKISKYSKSTQKTLIGSILSVTSLSKRHKNIHKYYTDLLESHRETKDKNKKTEKQEKNWLTWDKITEVKNKLKEKLPRANKRNVTANEYKYILHYLILSLYTELPPRRNKDYGLMFIVKKYNPTMPDKFNYYSVKDKNFIFNNYKTSKKYGQQIIDISDNDDLNSIIKLYLKHHPKYKNKNKTALLVKYDGTLLNPINGITRTLNKIFNKQIGSSMLRHIYLSEKYDKVLDEMKDDSKDMAHSLQQQKKYIKN